MDCVWLHTTLPNVPLIPSLFLLAPTPLLLSGSDQLRTVWPVYGWRSSAEELSGLRWERNCDELMGHTPAAEALQWASKDSQTLPLFDLMFLFYYKKAKEKKVCFKHLSRIFPEDWMKPSWKTKQRNKMKKASFAQIKTQKRKTVRPLQTARKSWRLDIPNKDGGEVGAGNEVMVSWNFLINYNIGARSSQSTASLWERNTVMTDSVNFKYSTTQAFPQQHIYTNVYLFIVFSPPTGVYRLDLQPSPCCVYISYRN